MSDLGYIIELITTEEYDPAVALVDPTAALVEEAKEAEELLPRKLEQVLEEV